MKKILIVMSIVLTSAIGCMGVWYWLRIRYERREAAAWRKKGVEGVALAHEELARKLEALMEANDGPLRVVFDRFCRHVDTLATRPRHPLNESERWNAKKELLDTVKKYLGCYPKWGEQRNFQEMYKKQQLLVLGIRHSACVPSGKMR